MTNRILRGIATTLFVLGLSAAACDGGEVAGAGSAGAAGAAGAGGAGGSTALVEGARCELGTVSNCDPSCEVSCGGGAGCIDLCCTDSATYGVVCNGTCQAAVCMYHDENDPACAAATAMPGQGSCQITATVKGRVYEIVAAADASGRGAPQLACNRTLPNRPSSQIWGVAPGAPCRTAGCAVCDEAAAEWATCCGR
jgi:hypothetical protein